MEKEQRSYEDQISALRDHKLKFEQLLESHRRDCDKKFSLSVCSSTNNSPNPAIVPTVSLGSHSNCSTPNSTTSSLSIPSHPTSSRRKQMNPKLSLDTSCAASHRLSSSSSSSEMLSPMILPWLSSVSVIHQHIIGYDLHLDGLVTNTRDVLGSSYGLLCNSYPQSPKLWFSLLFYCYHLLHSSKKSAAQLTYTNPCAVIASFCALVQYY